MPTVRTSLHSHSREGSHDASLTEREMAAAYRQAGFGPTAVTDHDVHTSVPDDRLAGIERTVEARSYLHVVEVGDRFSFLAHPSRPFPEDTRERAVEYVREHNLDGVEKYSRGEAQYPGRIDDPGIVELANDDAHNGFQIGLSYMVVDVREPTPEAVLREVERGAATLVNDPDPRRATVGKVRHGVELAAATGHRAVTPGQSYRRG